MVWSKKATLIVALTVMVILSVVIVPTAATGDEQTIAVSNAERTLQEIDGQTTAGLPSDIPSSTPSDVPSSVPTPSVRKRVIGSDYPSLVPSGQPSGNGNEQTTTDLPAPTPSAQKRVIGSDYPSHVPSSAPMSLGSDYPSIVPSSWGTPAPNIKNANRRTVTRSPVPPASMAPSASE
jgi:hypothetical protein